MLHALLHHQNVIAKQSKKYIFVEGEIFLISKENFTFSAAQSLIFYAMHGCVYVFVLPCVMLFTWQVHYFCTGIRERGHIIIKRRGRFSSTQFYLIKILQTSRTFVSFHKLLCPRCHYKMLFHPLLLYF